MTEDEFDEKWESHLEKGHYGMALGDEEYINYVDKKFEELKKFYPDFTYSQIKWKFGMARVYLENVPVRIINELEVTLNQMYEKNGRK